jgi:hypothetical protein
VQYLPTIPAGLDRKLFMKRLEEQIETTSNALAQLPPHPGQN